MCGVAGLLRAGAPLRTQDRGTLRTMRDTLFHRGPDQSGEFFADGVGLGSQRLKLLDLSERGALPMRSTDGKVVLAFNGEISNYLELASSFRLEETAPLRSGSDTEVFLRLYQACGMDFLQHLSGMFAFILLDQSAGKAYWGRDFYGINPLFQAWHDGAWHVASEIKSLLTVPGLDSGTDVQALYDLYTLAYIPGESTPYQAVREVPPGTYVELDLASGQLSTHRHYRFSFSPRQVKEKDAIELTREALLDSVERHMRSDAPVGAMCSGGIDTGGLVGIARHLFPHRDIPTYSLRIKDANFDESRFQRLVVERARTSHHQIDVGEEEVLQNFKAHIAFMDEPYGHGAALPTFLLAREARKKVKALLSGEGGDELFNAYETHGAYYWRGHWRRVPSPLRKLAREVASSMPVSHGKLSLDFKIKRFMCGAELPVHAAHLYWRHVLPDGLKEKLFKRRLLPTTRLSEEVFERYAESDDYSRLSAWDIEHFFFGDLMVKNDRMCLAHSVESRFPYMDRLVTDLVFTFPSELKVKGRRRRHLQKEALRPFLPPEVYQRDGFGLELPYNKWFQGALAPLYRDYFTEQFFEHFPFLDWDFFQGLLRDHQRRRADWGRFLWTTLVLCAWHDIHNLRKTAPALRRQVLLENGLTPP